MILNHPKTGEKSTTTWASLARSIEDWDPLRNIAAWGKDAISISIFRWWISPNPWIWIQKDWKVGCFFVHLEVVVYMFIIHLYDISYRYICRIHILSSSSKSLQGFALVLCNSEPREKERGISQCRYAIFPHARCRLFESFHSASNSRLQWSHETSCSSHFSPAAWSWRIWPQWCNFCKWTSIETYRKHFHLSVVDSGRVLSEVLIGTTRKPNYQNIIEIMQSIQYIISTYKCIVHVLYIVFSSHVSDFQMKPFNTTIWSPESARSLEVSYLTNEVKRISLHWGHPNKRSSGSHHPLFWPESLGSEIIQRCQDSERNALH